MKRNLRQLIKEELDIALTENQEIINIDKQIMDFKKKISDLEIKKANITKSNLSKSINEDEQLNEMPFLTGEKGEELFNAIKSSAESIKAKFPEASANDISKIILSKKKRPEYAPSVQTALDNQIEKFGGDPNYTDTLGGPQTLKAVEKALGLVEPKEPKAKAEPKAKPNKPSKETSVKSDKSKKTSPKPTSKKEDDDEDVEIEDTYYNDDDTSLPDDDADDKKAAKAAAKAEKEFQGKTTTAKSLTPEKEERYQKLSKGIKAKVSKLENLSTNARAKSPDISVLKQLINKKEVKDLFKAKGVDLNALVASVIN